MKKELREKLETLIENDLKNADTIGVKDEAKKVATGIVSADIRTALEVDKVDLEREKFEKSSANEKSKIDNDAKYRSEQLKQEKEFHDAQIAIDKTKIENDVNYRKYQLKQEKEFHLAQLSIEKERVESEKKFRADQLVVENQRRQDDLEYRSQQLKQERQFHDDQLEIERQKQRDDLDYRFKQLELEEKAHRRQTIISTISAVCTCGIALISKIIFAKLAYNAQKHDYEDYKLESSSSKEQRNNLLK